jgi:xylulokinase
VTLNREDGATLGAAIVAGLGTGLYKDIAATTQTWIKTKDHIEPNPKRHRQYQEFSTFYEQHLSDLNLLYSRKEASRAASSDGGAGPD